MLGFTALSQTPLSQASTALLVNAFIPGATAQFSTGTLLYEAIAFRTLNSVVANLNVAIEFDAKANTTVADTIASTAINAILTDAQASTVPTSVTASFSINDFFDVDAKAFVSFPDVSATTITEVVYPEAQGVAGIEGVALTLNNYDFTDEDAQANILLGTVSASFTVDMANPIAVKFPYQAYADQYNRNRTFFVSAYVNGSSTVHIAEEDYTVYIQKQQGSNTVYIAEEDYTVYIQKQQGSNTVYIAA
tara:strand:+ start:308 stop:1054 length:747 start_codon:yes stop_codon:yes gene_type:complete